MKYKSLNICEKQKEKYISYANKSFRTDRELKVEIVENGVILPAKKDNRDNPKLWAMGGIVDEKDNFVQNSESRYLFGGYYEHNEEREEYIDKEVVFMGPFIKHWGHFICDQISRLWYILDNPKDVLVAYCGWNWETSVSDLDGNFLEFMELLGLSKNQLINVQTPTRFKKIIIPEFSFIPAEYYSDQYLKLLDTVTTNALKGNYKVPKKVYLTRSQLLHNDKEKGEDKIIDYLSKIDYTVLSPEKLSLVEQIRIFNKSESVCMISGSISHNIMFNKSNNEIIILNNIDLINDYQMLIDHICTGNINYIDIYHKIKPVLFGKGPFLIYVSKYMQQYFKVKDSSKITSEDIKWFKDSYNRIYSIKENKDLLMRQNKNL